MKLSYEDVTESFLNKIREFEFLKIDEDDRQAIVDGYMKRSVANCKKSILNYNLSLYDDDFREFSDEIEDEDIDDLLEIITEGMVVQWLKPYVFTQENLENVLNTRDYSQYSPAELLKQVTATYRRAQKDFTQLAREYSYNHGDLTELHL